MLIRRHDFDRERLDSVFDNQWPRLAKSLGYARAQSHMLYLFFKDAETIYLAGSVLCPDSAKVGEALTLGAQAATALFICQPPALLLPIELGNGPPVVFDKPPPSGLAGPSTWLDAFHLCLIARQSQLCDALCRVPNDVFRTSDIVGAAEADYDFQDLLRAGWTTHRFTDNPSFAKIETSCLAPTLNDKYMKGIILPYLRALRAIDVRNNDTFADALADGLRGHKTYYSVKKYRKDFTGLVSLMLTGAAALAWDRGMRFDVQSDYMPQSWVTGELFRRDGHLP